MRRCPARWRRGGGSAGRWSSPLSAARCCGRLWLELDGAAIASGVIAVESKRKTIQHLEGGIIKEIVTAEGAHVAAGDVLIRFDDTQPRASLALLRGRLAAALALRARLVAERDGAGDITFPEELMSQAGEPAIARMMSGEIDVLRSRRSRIHGQESVLRERIDKQHREIVGLRAKVAASRQQLALVEEEIGPHEEMAARGVISRSSLLALKGQEGRSDRQHRRFPSADRSGRGRHQRG